MDSGATNMLWVEVMDGQPTGKWVALEGCPSGAKNGLGTKGVNPTMANGIKWVAVNSKKGGMRNARKRKRKSRGKE